MKKYSVYVMGLEPTAGLSESLIEYITNLPRCAPEFHSSIK